MDDDNDFQSPKQPRKKQNEVVRRSHRKKTKAPEESPSSPKPSRKRKTTTSPKPVKSSAKKPRRGKVKPMHVTSDAEEEEQPPKSANIQVSLGVFG